MPHNDKGRNVTEGRPATPPKNLEQDPKRTQHKKVMLPARDRQRENTAFNRAGGIPAHLRNNELFRTLQLNLFKALSTLPMAIAEGIVHHQDEMTGKQKYDLAAVGEALSSSIPLDFLSDAKSLQECYQITFNSLSRLNQTLNSSPRLVSMIGKKLLKSIFPFNQYLEGSSRLLEHSRLPEQYKSPLMRGLQSLKQVVELLTYTIQQGLELAEPVKGLPTLSHLEHFKQSFQLGFFRSIMPIPSTIVQVFIALHDAMTPEQRHELADIGKSFVTTVFDLITSRRTPEECFGSIAHSIQRLGKFLSNTPEILIKAGAHFLEAMIPFGNFIRKFAEQMVQSDLPDKPKARLSHAVEQVASVLNDFQTTIERRGLTPRP